MKIAIDLVQDMLEKAKNGLNDEETLKQCTEEDIKILISGCQRELLILQKLNEMEVDITGTIEEVEERFKSYEFVILPKGLLNTYSKCYKAFMTIKNIANGIECLEDGENNEQKV